jgi:hypothetical protein
MVMGHSLGMGGRSDRTEQCPAKRKQNMTPTIHRNKTIPGSLSTGTACPPTASPAAPLKRVRIKSPNTDHPSLSRKPALISGAG